MQGSDRDPLALRPQPSYLGRAKGRAMHISFVPGKGFSVEQLVSDAGALDYLVRQGVPRPEALRVMSALKASAVASSRADQVCAFIAEECVPDHGSILFADFLNRFRASLSDDQKSDWTRPQVSRALPRQYRPIPGTGNKRIVPGLSWRTI